MKKIVFLLVFTLTTFSNLSEAAKRYYEDAKFPTQQMVEKQTLTNPLGSSVARVSNDHAGITSTSAVTITSFDAQPDMSRNLTITPGGLTSHVGACTITISGTNIFGQSISETFSIDANESGTVTGSKAFKSVSSIAIPAGCEEEYKAATWDFGIGTKLGVKNCMSNAGDIFFSLLNGAKEGTAPTMAVDADEVEKNTSTFNGSLDGSNDYVLYFMQNYQCNPY
jgi:hypothetical protein